MKPWLSPPVVGWCLLAVALCAGLPRAHAQRLEGTVLPAHSVIPVVRSAPGVGRSTVAASAVPQLAAPQPVETPGVPRLAQRVEPVVPPPPALPRQPQPLLQPPTPSQPHLPSQPSLQPLPPFPAPPALPVPPPPSMGYPSGPLPPQPIAPPAAPNFPPLPPPPNSRPISLAEVRAMALANNRDLAVLGFAPRITETGIAAADGVFAPAAGFRGGMAKSFTQVSTEIQSLGSTSSTLREDTVAPLEGPNQLYVEKRLRTGGRIEAGLGSNYLNVDPVGTFVLFNPAWRAAANVAFEQPLFRGRGPVATLAPIRIAQANYSQSLDTLKVAINQLLRDVEVAYWTAYAVHRELLAREAMLLVSAETWQREAELLRIGQGTASNVAQAEEQMETYRAAVVDAQNRLAAAQRELRRLAGLHPADPRELYSAEMPEPVIEEVDFPSALSAAMQRPELKAQLASIEAAEVEMNRAGNLLAPDVAVRLGHTSVGLDNRLDQAIDNAWSGRFNIWSVGLIYRRSLGQPVEQAARQRAALALSREKALYAALEQRIQYELDAAHRNLADARRMLEVQRRRRDAASRQLAARRALYNENRATLLEQLDAESRLATSMTDEISAMLNYERALAQWNFAQGVYVNRDVAFDGASAALPVANVPPNGTSPADGRR